MSLRKSVSEYRVNIALHMTGFNRWCYSIWLFDESKKLFAYIHFTDKPNVENNVNMEGLSTLWAPVEAYQNTIDLLRNETPVFLVLYPSGKGLLTTSVEPVGEEES